MLPDANDTATILKLFGTGGITIIAVALIGYFKTRWEIRAKGSSPATGADPAAVMQAVFADHFASERSTTELKRIADGLEELVHVGNRICDRVDMLKMIGDFNRSKDR